MDENIFLRISSAELEEVRNNYVPVYADEFLTMYHVCGKIIIDEPAPVLSEYERAVDQAVFEAGFGTEPLRHCVEKLMTYLYVRMLDDGMRGFTEGEWRAIDEACDLLGIDQKNRDSKEGR